MTAGRARRVCAAAAAAAALILAFPGFAPAGMAEGTNQSRRTEVAPPIDAPDLDGDRVALSEIVARGPVVISFWATWCAPCLKELPALNAVVMTRRDSTVTARGHEVSFLTVNEDGPRNRAKIRPFWKRLGLSARVVPDDDGAIAERYRVRAFPTTVVVDTLGQVVAVHQGYRPGDEDLVARELDRLLAPRVVESPDR